MGRLVNLRPRLGRLAPRLKRHTDVEGHSQVAEPWRKWHSTARWRELRLEVLLRDDYTCRCGCNGTHPNRSQLVADHIVPHRGDPDLFWDPDNLQTLLKTCHDRWKQRLERRGRGV
jgi:5-methylcytosine-specific restriction protein A